MIRVRIRVMLRLGLYYMVMYKINNYYVLNTLNCCCQTEALKS